MELMRFSSYELTYGQPSTFAVVEGNAQNILVKMCDILDDIKSPSN
jgi:hypothetical protein